MKNLLKLSLFAFVFGLSSLSIGQDINYFTDANFRLHKFEAGEFLQIYYQQTNGIYLGNDYICYVDSKRDVFVNHNGEDQLFSQSFNEIGVTDNLLFMYTGGVIRIFDRGIRHILTTNSMAYGYGDSVVVFQDQIGGMVKYYYQDEVRDIQMYVNEYPMSQDKIGANLFVFQDNTNNFSVFWRGQFYDLIGTNEYIKFKCGQDVMAFNDPLSGTFVIFDNGYVLDADSQHALRYECGNNFVYFQDAAGVNKVIREERETELGYDLQNIIVRDSIVYFKDAGIAKVWYNEEIYQIFNNTITAPQIDGGIMAYVNNYGGVSAFVRGEEVEITKSRVENFRLNGNTIMLQYSPTAFAVWWNGKIYEF